MPSTGNRQLRPIPVTVPIRKAVPGQDATYALALPDVPRFRGLVDRLPAYAGSRIGLHVLFVGPDASVTVSR